MQGRHLLEHNMTVNTHLEDVMTVYPRQSVTSELVPLNGSAADAPAAVKTPVGGLKQHAQALQARRMLHHF